MEAVVSVGDDAQAPVAGHGQCGVRVWQVSVALTLAEVQSTNPFFLEAHVFNVENYQK